MKNFFIGSLVWICLILKSQVEISYFKFTPEYSDDYESAKKTPEKIKYLDLSLQKITTLPDLSIFTNLEWLDISFNKITSFGTSICQLKKLKYLNISGNYNVTSIPDCFKNLTTLDTLKAVDMRLPEKEFDKLKSFLPKTVIIRKEKFE